MSDAALALVASGPFLAALVPLVAVTASLLMLSIVGGTVRAAFSLDKTWKPLGVDVMLGMIVTITLFCAWSLVHHLILPFGVPDGAFLPLVLLFAFIVRRADFKAALAEAVQPFAWLSLALFVLSLVYSARCFFGPDYCGEDPAVMAAILEPTRRAGFLSQASLPLPGAIVPYPALAILLPWTLATPFVSSLAIEQLYPSVAVSLLVFASFETGAWLFQNRASWAANARVPIVLTAFLVRLSLLSFDVEMLGRQLAGTLKLAHGAWIVLALYAAVALKRTQRRIWGTVAIVACAFVALANPVNVAVALTALAGVILSGFLGKTGLRGVLAAAAVLLLIVVQDPLFIQGGAPGSVRCALVRDLDYCRAPAAAFGAAKAPLADSAWRDFVPASSWNPIRLTRPSETLLNGRGKIALYGLALVGAFAVLVGLQMRERRRLLLGVAMLFVVYVLLVHASVYAFHTLRPSARYMLGAYTELAWMNAWSAGISLLVAAGAMALLHAATYFWQRRKAAAITMIAGSVTGAVWLVPKGLARSGEAALPIGDALRKSADVAAIVRALQSELKEGDVIHALTWVVDYGSEEWAWQSQEEVALELMTRRRVMYGFSYDGAWPRSDVPMQVHAQRLCRGDCAYLRELGVTAAVAFQPATREACGKTPLQFLEASACFERGATVGGDRLQATVFRLRAQ